jgi:maleate isomerase
MYGEGGRIGLIVPSNNTVVEQEFRRMLPEGITSYATRMRNTQSDAADLERMVRHATRGADELATADVNVIAFACTSGSLLHGLGWEENLRKNLETAAGGIPCVTTAQAVIEAFRHLGIRRAVVATPYLEEINRAEQTFFESCGIEVLRIRGLGILNCVEMGRCRPEEVLELVMGLEPTRADGVFISCTNFRAIDVLPAIESRTGKPAFSSNVATLWACVKRLPTPPGPIPGFGRLLAS